MDRFGGVQFGGQCGPEIFGRARIEIAFRGEGGGHLFHAMRFANISGSIGEIGKRLLHEAVYQTALW